MKLLEPVEHYCFIYQMNVDLLVDLLHILKRSSLTYGSIQLSITLQLFIIMEEQGLLDEDWYHVILHITIVNLSVSSCIQASFDMIEILVPSGGAHNRMVW